MNNIGGENSGFNILTILLFNHSTFILFYFLTSSFAGPDILLNTFKKKGTTRVP